MSVDQRGKEIDLIAVRVDKLNQNLVDLDKRMRVAEYNTREATFM